MAEYTIITDSSCDLPDDVAAQLGVKVVPLSLTLGGKEYLNTTDARGIPNKELYARLRAGEVSKTSAANADVFVAAMEPRCRPGATCSTSAFPPPSAPPARWAPTWGVS